MLKPKQFITQRIKYLAIIIVILGMVIGMICIFSGFNKKSDASPNILLFKSINVTDSYVHIKGEFTSGFNSYNSFESKYEDERLYITIYKTLVMKGSSRFFDIELNDDFSNLEGIYIVYENSNKLIWEKENLPN